MGGAPPLYDAGTRRTIGEMLGAVDGIDGTILEIEACACDYLREIDEQKQRAAALVETRKSLARLADAARELQSRLDDLEISGDLYLSLAAQKRGLQLDHAYVDGLAAAARLAVELPDIKPGPVKNKALAQFIRALIVICQECAGWRPGITNDRHYPVAPFGGRFFDLVTVCLAPIGPEQAGLTNKALGKVIQSALAECPK